MNVFHYKTLQLCMLFFGYLLLLMHSISSCFIYFFLHDLQHCIALMHVTCFLGHSLSMLCYVNWHLMAALEFAPDLTIISAGFDAARGDPLGCCDVRILFFLE